MSLLLKKKKKSHWIKKGIRNMGFDTNLKLTCRVLVNLKVYNFVYQFKMCKVPDVIFFVIQIYTISFLIRLTYKKI